MKSKIIDGARLLISSFCIEGLTRLALHGYQQDDLDIFSELKAMRKSSTGIIIGNEHLFEKGRMEIKEIENRTYIGGIYSYFI